MNRREFPKRVYAAIVHRAMNDRGQIVCEGCGYVLGKKPYNVDHTIPDALVLDKSRPLTAADGKLLGKKCCHDPKSKIDVGNIAKAVRRDHKLALGIRKRSTFACSRDTPWKRTIDGRTVPR